MLNEYVFLKWAEKAFEAKKIYIFFLWKKVVLKVVS